jgi:hypothetical protein
MQTQRSTQIVKSHKRRTPLVQDETHCLSTLLHHTVITSNVCCHQPWSHQSRQFQMCQPKWHGAQPRLLVTCPAPKDYPCNPEEICTLITCCSLWSKASVHICETQENSKDIGKPTSATNNDVRDGRRIFARCLCHPAPTTTTTRRMMMTLSMWSRMRRMASVIRRMATMTTMDQPNTNDWD